MALSTLRYEGNTKKHQTSGTAWSGDCNGGMFKTPLTYSGDPTEFYSWEFRARARIAGTKPEERSLVTARLVEGLVGDAFQVARDIGLDKLQGDDGFELLCDRMRRVIFPMQKQEAKELLRLGQTVGSIMSRQHGEPMSSYINRRKRWWKTLKELDGTIEMSTTMLGDLMLDHSGLTKIERLLVLTSTNNSTAEADVEWALVEQHGAIHHDEMRREGRNDQNSRRPPQAKWTPGPKHHAHAAVPEEVDEEIDDGDDPEGFYEDDVEEAQLEALVGLLDDGFDDPDDLDDLGQAQCTAYLAKFQRKGKGKGKGPTGRPSKGSGKGSSLTLEDRRAKLRQLKEKSTCKVCFRKGHWAGDPQCTGKKPPQASRPALPSPVKEKAAHFAFAVDDDDSVETEDKAAFMANRQHAREIPVEEEEQEEEMLPPDESPVINFGQYKGFTYRQVVIAYPQYADWAVTQKNPGEALTDFVKFVWANYRKEGKVWAQCAYLQWFRKQSDH